MGTHPIFESDFDCLTDRDWLLPKSKWQRKLDEERRLSWPFKRTKPTSSVTKSSSADDVKVKLTTSPVSACVFKTKISTILQSIVLLSVSRTRTSSPKSHTLALSEMLSFALLTRTSSHVTEYQSV